MDEQQPSNAPQAPAGWYPDPDRAGQQRYWNGASWLSTAPSPAAGIAPQRSGWYRPGVVILLLVLFFPVGLFLMWRGQLWNPRARWVVSGVVALLMVIGVATDSSTPEPNLNTASTLSAPETEAATVVVPSGAGTSVSEFTSALSAAGLTLGSLTETASSSAAYTVISQQPAAGTRVAAGATVSLVVSSGPVATAVPPKTAVTKAPAKAKSVAKPPTAKPKKTAAPKPKPKPKPKKTAKPKPVSTCDPNYSGGCVPNNQGDINCPDIGFSVVVIGVDIYGLDRDGDGIGCDS